MKCIPFLLFILFIQPLYSQSGKETSKKTAKEKEKVRKLLGSKIAEAKKDFDEASFKYAVSYCDTRQIYELNEKFEKYQKTLGEFVKLVQDDDYQSEDGILINEVGELYFAYNKFGLAEEAFKASKKIFSALGQIKTLENAQTFSNLSLLYYATGRYTLSEQLGDSAMHLREEILPKESSLFAMSLNNLGVLYSQLGDFKKAEEYLSEAVRINEKALTKRSVPYTLSLNNRAMLMHRMGTKDESEETLLEALRLAYDVLKERSLSYNRIMQNLVNMYLDNERFSDAEVMCLKLLKNKENKVGADHPDLAFLYNLLGSIYMHPLNLKKRESEDAFRKSIAILNKSMGENDPALIEPSLNLGNLCRVTDKEEEGERFISHALNLATESLYDIDENYIAALQSMGLICWERKKINEAGKYLKLAVEANLKLFKMSYGILPVPIKNRYSRNLSFSLSNFYSFSTANHKSNPSFAGDVVNFHLNSKTLIFSSNRKQITDVFKNKDAKSIDAYHDWIDKRERLCFLYQFPKKYGYSEGMDTDVLEREATTLHKSLSLKSPAFARFYIDATLDIKDIFQLLEKDEAIVQIVKFPKFNKSMQDTVQYAAIILTKDKLAPSVIFYKDGQRLEGEYFQSYKKNLRLNTKDEESYNNYWAAIENQIKNKERIYFSGEGVFKFINLNTLLSPNGYLHHTRKIIQISDLNYFNDFKIKKKEGVITNSVIIGFPEYGSKGLIPRLPGSLAEVEAIKNLMDSNSIKTELLTQKNASEKKLKEQKDVMLLHIGSHASINSKSKGFKDITIEKKSLNYFHDRLMESGIVLAGAEKALNDPWQEGILTSREITDLKLKNENIVVLSWIDTWKQDVNFDDLSHLECAFKAAGTKAILLSLWKSEDEVSGLFLNQFYNNYLNTRNLNDSFLSAEKTALEKSSNPFDWGGFVLRY